MGKTKASGGETCRSLAYTMTQSWILLGMMGAGKSSVGRRLSTITGRRFLDTDQLLQNRLGRSINQIFQLYGEEAFRDHESSILRQLEPGHDIVSTGGGIVLREENWNELRRLGPTIYLRASPETLIDRLQVSKKRRPLLAGEAWDDKLREILNRRVPLYEQADATLDVDQLPIEEVCEKIVRLFGEGN
jgi:shikimate kinase